MKRLSLSLAVLLVILVAVASTTYATWDHSDNKKIEKEIVVLLHGLGRSNAAMWLLALRLEHAGYHVERVGYSSLNQTPEEMLYDITKQINECCAQHDHTVHFAGHSLGGLLVRAYLEDNKVKNLGRVVLMGTPNQGTEIVDRFRDKWWMQLLGPAALSLGTDDESFPSTLEAPDYPVGVIAGEYKSDANDEILPGKDDGLVSVESTKLEGMTDFIIVETGHSLMRYNEDVAMQAIFFLKNGKFSR